MTVTAQVGKDLQVVAWGTQCMGCSCCNWHIFQPDKGRQGKTNPPDTGEQESKPSCCSFVGKSQPGVLLDNQEDNQQHQAAA